MVSFVEHKRTPGLALALGFTFCPELQNSF